MATNSMDLNATKNNLAVQVSLNTGLGIIFFFISQASIASESACEIREPKAPVEAIQFLLNPELRVDQTCLRNYQIFHSYRQMDTKYFHVQLEDNAFRKDQPQLESHRVETLTSKSSQMQFSQFGSTARPLIPTIKGYTTLNGNP